MSDTSTAASSQQTPVYLRLSVTDRCNLRCGYCMPAHGVRLLPRSELLSLEGLAELVTRLARAVAIDRIRLTGGEPLVRKNLSVLVEQLAQIPGRPLLALTTNGTFLAEQASTLRQAGINRVNVSIDTLDPDVYRKLTMGELEPALKGIDTALSAGFDTVKLNTVLLAGINQDEILDLTRFAFSRGMDIRFIEWMPRGNWSNTQSRVFFPADQALEILAGEYALTPADSSRTTARMYHAQNGARSGQVGVIAAVSHPFCHSCRRLRLDARGHLFPCLMSERQIDLVQTLSPNLTDAQLAEMVGSWLTSKSTMSGSPCTLPMSQIGG